MAKKGGGEQLRGIKKYFNSETVNGRANVSKVTLGALFIFAVYQLFLKSYMAGGEELKGLSKYFNGSTMAGRANVAKATYASVGLIIMYFSLKPKSKK